MSTKFKPSTSYRFTKEDMDFVLELSKIGYVKLLSCQVSLVSDDKGLSFKEWSSSDESLRCDGLSLPDNWVIEGIWFRENGISVTFGVSAPEEK